MIKNEKVVNWKRLFTKYNNLYADRYKTTKDEYFSCAAVIMSASHLCSSRKRSSEQCEEMSCFIIIFFLNISHLCRKAQHEVIIMMWWHFSHLWSCKTRNTEKHSGGVSLEEFQLLDLRTIRFINTPTRPPNLQPADISTFTAQWNLMGQQAMTFILLAYRD